MTFFWYYVSWHYGAALGDLYRNWTNFLWFFYNFFSIEILLKTLFSPFQRLGEEYTIRGLDIERIASTLVVNTLMRLVGAGVRTLIILIGLVVLILTMLVGAAVLFVWLMGPLFAAILFIAGIGYVAT